MTNFLIRFFVKDPEDIKDSKVVRSYGFLCGFVGIATNTLLAIIKIIMGLAINSIAVVADAVNNFSDIGASVVTLVGFYVAGKPADEEHPFGHGRAEYLSALVLSLMVIVVGIQFLRSSWLRIIDPQPIEFSIGSLMLLILSVLLKVWQSRLYKVVGKKIRSNTLIAASLDSMSDVAITSIVIASLIISRFITFPIDGYIGLAVSLLIIYNGYNIVKEVIDPILGSQPDEEQCKEIIEELTACEGIMGTHDLIVHNYGSRVILATVHAEVSDKLGLIEAHDIIDRAEKHIQKKMGINMLIHMDPINFDDPMIKDMFDRTKSYVQGLESEIDIHDFRVVHNIDREVIFDMVVPIKLSSSMTEEIKQKAVGFLKDNYNVSRVYIDIERANIIV